MENYVYETCCEFKNVSDRTESLYKYSFFLSACPTCVQKETRKILENPHNILFETMETCPRHSYSERLRKTPEFFYRAQLTNALCFSPLCLAPRAPHVQRNMIPLLKCRAFCSLWEWDFLAAVFNHASVERFKNHRRMCKVCSPCYRCDFLKNGPVHLLSMYECDASEVFTSPGMGPRTIIDGNFLSVVNSRVDLSLWPGKEGLGHNVGPFHFKRTFFLAAQTIFLQKQTAFSQLLATGKFSQDDVRAIVEDLCQNCHAAVEHAVRKNRQMLGMNSTYMLHEFGLFKAPVSLVLSTRVHPPSQQKQNLKIIQTRWVLQKSTEKQKIFRYLNYS